MYTSKDESLEICMLSSR